MSIIDLVNQLSLVTLTPKLLLQQSFSKIIATDLLESALQKIEQETLWITANPNLSVLSVAYFKKAAAILMVGAENVDSVMIETAIKKRITLLKSHEPTYLVCGKLYGLLQLQNLCIEIVC